MMLLPDDSAAIAIQRICGGMALALGQAGVLDVRQYAAVLKSSAENERDAYVRKFVTSFASSLETAMDVVKPEFKVIDGGIEPERND
jgi:hypothetical protein